MSIKLTAPQEKMLRKIVATNGGGIFAECQPIGTIKALFNRGLIQGKKGDACCAVHTREGLDWVRENHHDHLHSFLASRQPVSDRDTN